MYTVWNGHIPVLSSSKDCSESSSVFLICFFLRINIDKNRVSMELLEIILMPLHIHRTLQGVIKNNTVSNIHMYNKSIQIRANLTLS